MYLFSFLSKMYSAEGFILYVTIIIVLSPLSTLAYLECKENTEKTLANIFEDVTPPSEDHDCDLTWGDSYNSTAECKECNRRVPMLEYSATFSDCDITIDLLLGLQEVINYALYYFEQGFRDNNHLPQFLRQNDRYCSFPGGYSNVYSTCEDIVSAMQATMCELIHQICLLYNPEQVEKCFDDMPTPRSTTTGPTTTTERPGNPEDQICIQCLKDAITVYSGKLKEIQTCLVEALNTMKQKHAAEVVILNTEISSLKQGLAKTSWDLMLAQIENPETAAIQFPLDYDDSCLRTYVEQVYSLDNYVNILVFGYRLPRIAQMSLVYYTLYDVVYTNNHENHGNIIVFMNYLIKAEEKFCPMDLELCGPQFNETIQHVKLYRDDYVRIASDAIRSGHWRGLLEIGNPTVVNDVGESFKLILEDLIDKTYRDFNSTLTFIKDIRWNEHRYVALQRFKFWVTNQYHILSIAYEIQNAHDNLQGPDSHKAEETKKDLEDLMTSLNINVQVIAWDANGGSTLNARQGGFLAPGGDGGGYTGVFLASSPANNKWKFVKVHENLNENGGKRFGFRIRHQSGVFLGVPSPIRVDGFTEHLSVESFPSDNLIGEKFFWELKFGNQEDQIYLYHPERRLHVGKSGLFRSGSVVDYDYMVVTK